MMDVKKRKILTAVAQTLINECDEPFVVEHVSAFLYNNIKSASKRKILAVGAAAMSCSSENFDDENPKNNNNNNEVAEIGDTGERNTKESEAEVSYFCLNPTDKLFRELFRIDKSTFEVLLKSLGVVFHPPNKPTHPCSLQPQDKVLLILYILGTQDSFRNIANKFKLNTGNCYCIYMNFCSQLHSAVERFISWPGVERRQKIKDVVSGVYGIKNIVGVVGNICISVKQPENESQQCSDKTGYYPVSLQAVCDHRMRFINISTRWVGSLNNVNIWKNSWLYQQLQSKNSKLMSPEEHLVGNGAYPLDEFIMTPFSLDGELTLDELHYNSIHKEITLLIQKAFVLLVRRFTRLKLMDVLAMEKISKIITAACVLHNVITEAETRHDELIDYDLNSLTSVRTDATLLQSYNDAAIKKRNEICLELMNNKKI